VVHRAAAAAAGEAYAENEDEPAHSLRA
jgi:hypothetical protein